MSLKKIKCYLFILILFFSCHNKIDKRSMNSIRLLKNSNLTYTDKKVIFLPTSFCGACSQESVEIIKDVFSNKKMLL